MKLPQNWCNRQNATILHQVSSRSGEIGPAKSAKVEKQVPRTTLPLPHLPEHFVASKVADNLFGAPLQRLTRGSGTTRQSPIV